MQMISCLIVPPHVTSSNCDNFACEYDVVFNADKSKLLICRSSKQCKVVRDIKGRPFHIRGRDIEQVDSFSHLGHIITSDFSDTEDIRYRRNRFVGQVNNNVFSFSKLKYNVKLKLFNTYCSSMCGCELWSLSN